MAIDAKWKRHSAQAAYEVFGPFTKHAYGSMGAGDRATASWEYGGIVGGGGGGSGVAGSGWRAYMRLIGRKIWR